MITIYQKTIKDVQSRVLEEFRPGSWIHALKPSEEDFTRMHEQFSLQIGHLKDALDPLEVPRLEAETEATYIFLRVPYRGAEKDLRITTTSLLIVMGKDFVMTVAGEELPFLERFISGKISFTTTQKTKFLFQLFSEINAVYHAALTDIRRQIRSVSGKLEKITNQDVIQFIMFESMLNDFLSGLVPQQVILESLLTGRHVQLFEDDRDLAEDLALGSGQLIEYSKSTLKNIVNIREAYATIITNNLNRVIKLLTALTIILAIPTMVASFYGMNVVLPFAAVGGAFWLIVGVAVLASLGVFIIFAKNEWL